jgi:hypothetical protein
METLSIFSRGFYNKNCYWLQILQSKCALKVDHQENTSTKIIKKCTLFENLTLQEEKETLKCDFARAYLGQR